MAGGKPILLRDISKTDTGFFIELVSNYLFGDRTIELFDENKLYNKGDVVLFIDEDGNKILRQPIKNNVTGEYNPELWEKITISELINIDRRNKEIIQVAVRPPKSINNMIWVNPLEYSSSDRLDDIGNDDSLDSSRTEDGTIEFSSTTPQDDDNRMWIRPINVRTDYEFDIEGLELAFVTGVSDIKFSATTPEDGESVWGEQSSEVLISGLSVVPGEHDETNVKFAGNEISFGTTATSGSTLWFDTTTPDISTT